MPDTLRPWKSNGFQVLMAAAMSLLKDRSLAEGETLVK